MKLQDELREISNPIYDKEMEQRRLSSQIWAKSLFNELKDRAVEKAKKGDRMAMITINPRDRFTYPRYDLEDLLKENFDRYSIDDFGKGAVAIYVYWT